MNTQNSPGYIIKKTIMTIFSAIFCAVLIMLLLYSINTDNIQKHVAQTEEIYKTEHLYFFLSPQIHSSMLDNFTDSILMNIAAFKKGKNFQEIKNNAFLNPHYEYSGLSPHDSLIKAYSQNGIKDSDYEIEYYSRYWHGHLLYLKPLLVFFNFSEIRCINMAVQLILLFLVTIELYKKGYKDLFLPLFCALYVLNPISSAICLQYCCIFYITLIFTLIMLKKEIYNSPQYIYYFLWLGIITSFFDILSYPLVSLGITLIILIALSNRQSPIKQVFLSTLFWSTGFLSMSSAKWVIATILTKQNVINNACAQILHRINGTEVFLEQYTLIDVIKSNINALINKPFCAVMFCVLLYCLYLFISKKHFFKFDLKKNIALLMIAISPFLWFTIFQNHSIVHHWCVHKNLSITVMAIMYIIISSFQETKETGVNSKE